METSGTYWLGNEPNPMPVDLFEEIDILKEQLLNSEAHVRELLDEQLEDQVRIEMLRETIDKLIDRLSNV